MLPPIAAGVLRALGYLPGPFFLVSFVAFVPWLAWLDARPAASGRERFRAGFAFGLATYLVALHFMKAMAEYSWLAWLLYGGLALGLAVRVGLSAMLLGWLRERSGLGWGVLLPAVWLATEWLQTWGDLRLTGDHVSVALARAPWLVQFVEVTGPYGAGALVLAINGLLADAWHATEARSRRRSLAAIGLLALVVGAYDAWAWRRPLPDAGSLRVGFVQPNVPILVKRGDRGVSDEWGRLVELTADVARRGAELVVWPETARPLPLLHRPDHPSTFAMPEVADLARATGVAILTGVDYVRFFDDREGYDRFNAAMAVDPQGRLLDAWGAKVYLVPFTEGVPFEALLGPFVRGREGEWRWVAGGFTPGPESALVELAGVRVGALVCYEQLFADLARGLRNRGAALQAVVTNDAWFGRTFFQGLQADVLRMRAIENRTSYVRVANTGISGFVDRRGRYRERTALFERDARVAEIALAGPPTVYDRVGDLPAWAAVALTVGLCVLARRAPHARPPG